NQLFTVVGVFESEAQIFADAVRHFAIFPYTSAVKTLGVNDAFLTVLVIPEETASQQAVMDRVTGALRSMRGLGPGDDNNFAVIRSDQLVEIFNQLTGVFFLVMLALSSVALMVGGIGVVGIMMIAVTERTREIGIRKAVGATRREILWQFLVEASLLTLSGGALGLAVGGIAARALSTWTPIPATIPLWSVGAALAMAGLTGMLFGLLPAVRASKLDPVLALGYE
ncbi:MAG: ABC transporter permease, partial [Longimicrobiales bacterium]